MRQSDGELDISDGLAELREGLEKQDILTSGTLDQLVRDQAIDSQMATSLMNDSTFAYEVGMRMIEITEDIYIAEGVEVKKPEEELVLA